MEAYFDLQREGISYVDDEQVLDYLRLADLIFSILLHEREQEDTTAGIKVGLGIDESQVHLALLSSRQEYQGFWEYPLVMQAVAYMKGREEQNYLIDNKTRLLRISEKYELDFKQRFCLVLSCASDWDRKYERIFALFQGDNRLINLTVGLGTTLCGVLEEKSSSDYGILKFSEKQNLLYRQSDESKINSCLKRQLIPLDSVRGYLRGDDKLPMCLQNLAEYRQNLKKQDAVLGNELVKKLTFLCRNYNQESQQEGMVIQLLGRTGDGRKFTLEQVCYHLNKNLLVVDASALLELEEYNREEFYECLQELILFAQLQNVILCLDDMNPEFKQKMAAGIMLKKMYKQLNILFFTSSVREHIYPVLGTEILLFEFPKADFYARQAYWEIFLKDTKREQAVDAVQMANIYQYNVGQIQAVTQMAKRKAVSQCRDTIYLKDIVESVRDYNSRRMGNKAHLIGTFFELDDLVLDSYQKKKILEACNQIKNRNVVQNEWNFGKKTPYGKGLSILLYGAPGVGKTMSVQIISKVLGLDAYRIDLSQIVSKYIGETEKNLGEIFDMAKNSCSILFFDEADALFTKRTDVKDSKDKYANMETAFLLQKIEEHDGIVILASNHINNFDEAFQRRMQYIINIPLPGAELRLQMWKNAFPKEAPLSEDIHFEFLAEKFELSGSRIKSIAIHAAYFAAEEMGDIQPLHILRALQSDMAKGGRLLSADELGPYASLFPEL